MLAYLILGLSLAITVLLGARWFISADPRLLAKIVRNAALGLLVLLAAFLLLTGRFALGLLPAVLAYTLWRARRSGPARFPSGGWTSWGQGGGSGSGRSSNVDTDYLRMSLRHDTGQMDGEVLKGQFAGQNLADLSLESLLSLLAECYAEDQQSVTLLETYLDRVHGPEWRDRAQQDAGSSSSGPRATGMTRQEAMDILGVDASAGPEEIRAAHHRQMLKHHPDRGGSSYLAAKINEAKDILLQP